MTKKKSQKDRAAEAAKTWDWRDDRWMRDLTTYNAECSRGLVHTPACDERMVTLQGRFDQKLAQEAQWAAESHVSLERAKINLR